MKPLPSRKSSVCAEGFIAPTTSTRPRTGRSKSSSEHWQNA
jgi:hypothetical protein